MLIGAETKTIAAIASIAAGVTMGCSSNIPVPGERSPTLRSRPLYLRVWCYKFAFMHRHQCFIYEGARSRDLPAVMATIKQKLRENHRCLYLDSPPIGRWNAIIPCRRWRGCRLQGRQKEPSAVIRSTP